MSRYILLISISLLTQGLFSQNVGFLGKKNTIETTLGVSASSLGSIGSMQSLGFYIPMRNHIQLNRSMGRMFGMGFEFSHAYPKFGFEKTRYHENSYWGTGINFNFYTEGSIAPFGKYFSFYLKYNSGKSNKFSYTEYKNQVYTKRKGELLISYMTTGVSFNSMTFLSKETPLYFKYSIRFGIPFNTNMELNGRTLTESKAYDIRAINYKLYLNTHEYFELSFGLGYIF